MMIDILANKQGSHNQYSRKKGDGALKGNSGNQVNSASVLS